MGWARHRGVLFQSEDYGQVIDALRKPSSRRDGIPWYVDEPRRGHNRITPKKDIPIAFQRRRSQWGAKESG
jgi:hypothetical protein